MKVKILATTFIQNSFIVPGALVLVGGGYKNKWKLSFSNSQKTHNLMREKKKITNNYVFATKINTHTRSLNYTTVHIN